MPYSDHAGCLRESWFARLRAVSANSRLVSHVAQTGHCGSRYSEFMAFSFSAKKRKQFNRQLPQVQSMLAAANGYGYSRGTVEDKQTFEYLLEDFARSMQGISGSSITFLETALAEEASGSEYPIAVNAAWAVASALPQSSVTMLGKAMGTAGVVNAATWFTDEFPGKVRTPVMGQKISAWRVPAAIAAMLMMTHADENELNS